MPTTAQRLAETDYRNFYLDVHGEPPDWQSGTDAPIGDTCHVSRADFLGAFLARHPQHEGHREFLERTLTQLHEFPVSRAAWRRVVGNQDALPEWSQVH
jgi:hypothetical protein